MTRTIYRALPALLLASLMLVACSKDKQPAAVAAASATTSPESAVMATVKLVKAGDFKTLAHTALPPADYAAIAKQWATQAADDSKISAEDRAKFAEQIKTFNAPDCADKLYQQISPALDQFASKYKAQLPMYVGMGQTMLGSMIDRSKTIEPVQKQQAKDAIAAMGQWVESTDWGNKDTARKALAITCDTVRGLNLTTLDAARKLSFDQVLEKYGSAWGGIRKVFALYGMNIDQMLDSTKVKTISNDGTHAVVQTTVEFLGKPMATNTKLVKRDGHWYNEDFLKSVETKIAATAPIAAAASAAAPH